MASASGQDADRALTEKGASDARNMAKWLKKHLPKDVQIYCSPAVRCKQTLDALLAFASKEKFKQVEYTKALALESNVSTIRQQLLGVPSSSTILLVGHQPLLGDLATHLLLGQRAVSLEIKKGAVWWLRHPQHHAFKGSESGMPLSLALSETMALFTVQHPKLFR